MPNLQNSSESVNVDVFRYMFIDQSPINDELDVLSLSRRNSQEDVLKDSQMFGVVNEKWCDNSE